MNATTVNPYLRTKIMTASPEELRLMLYDGAIKFCKQALPALESKDYSTSYNCLMRAQKIVLELSSSLNHQVNPELCQRLSSLYTYIYRRLVDANIQREPTPVNEVLKLLDYERETWVMLMSQLAKEKGTSPSAAAVSGAQQTAMSISTGA